MYHVWFRMFYKQTLYSLRPPSETEGHLLLHVWFNSIHGHMMKFYIDLSLLPYFYENPIKVEGHVSHFSCSLVHA